MDLLKFIKKTILETQISDVDFLSVCPGFKSELWSWCKNSLSYST